MKIYRQPANFAVCDDQTYVQGQGQQKEYRIQKRSAFHAHTYFVRAVGKQVAGEGVSQDAELVLADVLGAAELLGVRARGHPVIVPIPDETIHHRS